MYVKSNMLDCSLDCVDENKECESMVKDHDKYCEYSGDKVKYVTCRKSCGTCGEFEVTSLNEFKIIFIFICLGNC